MAAQVAHRAVAEVPPAVPLRSGQVDVVERPGRGGTEPEIPVEALGHGVRRRGALLHEHDVAGRLRFVLRRVQAPRARHPHVALADGADGAALDQLDDAAIVVARVDLRAHLRRHAGRGRRLADHARLRDVVRERLLAVDVLLQLERRQRGERVGVLGRAHHDGVEVAGPIEQPTEVLLSPRSRKGGACLVERRAIHVTKHRDVLGRDRLEVVGAPAAAPDDRKAQLVAALSAKPGGRRQQRGRRHRGDLEEIATAEPVQDGHVASERSWSTTNYKLRTTNFPDYLAAGVHTKLPASSDVPAPLVPRLLRVRAERARHRPAVRRRPLRTSSR